MSLRQFLLEKGIEARRVETALILVEFKQDNLDPDIEELYWEWFNNEYFMEDK